METSLKSIIISAAILGLCLLGGLAVLGNYIADSRAGETITVTGSTKKSVSADLAKWNSNFTRRANLTNLKQTIDQVNNDASKIKTFITGYGLPENSITFLPIQTDAIYEVAPGGYGMTQNVIGYTVRQEVRVESNDIDKIEKLAKEAQKLIDQGIVPEYQRTEYFYTKIVDLRPELFAEATKDAQKRAEAIASGTGSSVGSIRSARTGVIQILAPNSLDVADYGAYDLSTREKEISATVSATFELKN